MFKQALHYICSLLSLIAVCALWKHNILLFVVLSIIATTMMLIYKQKTEIILFFACSFYGAFAEVIAIYFGAWNYTLKSFLGIPIWLPVLWGIASIFMKRLHEHIATDLLKN